MEDLRDNWQDIRCVTKEEREQFNKDNVILLSNVGNAKGNYVRSVVDAPTIWEQLKDTILELRDSGGNLNQQQTCDFLANYMDVLEQH